MKFDMLKAFMDSLVNQGIPGNSISLYYNNEEIFKYSAGFRSLEDKTPMDGSELLNIYSCSKIATVIAALQLYEQGIFLLSDPLYEYIPEFKDMYVKTADGERIKAKNPITVANLFTMTAGFDYDTSCKEIQKAKEITNGDCDTLTVVKCLAEKDLNFEPGTHWNYSLCHDILAGLVESISGMRFSEYVKKNIFEPIGVTDIYYHRNEEIKSRMAEQYIYKLNDRDIDFVSAQQKTPDGKGYIENAGKECGFEFGRNYDSGGAGIVVSVGDYAKFANALANGGKAANGERILSSSTVNLLKTNQLSAELRKDFNWSQLKGYGYGLGVRTMIDCAGGGSNGNVGEFGWGGAAGATMLADTQAGFSYFYSHHMLNPREEYYQPRLRNVVYSCMSR